MLDSSWSDLAFSDGQQIVSDSGQIKVIRLGEAGPALRNLDEADSRFSLRWMLWHHAREILGSFREWRPEFFDWKEKFSANSKLVLKDEIPESISFPRGPVSFSRKLNFSAPVLGKDFHPCGDEDREPVFRVMTCHQNLGGGDVEVWRDAKKSGRALFHQIVKCGDFWRCPICSHRITMGRRAEISDIYNQVVGRGQGAAYLVTFTVPHQKTDLLEDLLRQMLYARDRLGEGAWGKSLTRPAGKTQKSAYRLGDIYVGRMRTLEITYSSVNGWHPHMHEMWVFQEEVPKIRSGLFDSLPAAWGDACEDWWLKRPGVQGVDMRRMYSNSEYLAKFGGEKRSWGPEYELAAGHGKTKTVGPWTLLENSMYGDLQSRAAFIEYAHALKAVGPSSIHVGGRLAYAIKQLGLTASDDHLLSSRLGSDAELLATLTKEEFRLISKNFGFENVLRLIETAGIDAAREWISSLGTMSRSQRLFA